MAGWVWKLMWGPIFGEYKGNIFPKSHQLNLNSLYIIFTDKGQIEQSKNELTLNWQKAFLCTWRKWLVEVFVFVPSAKLANEFYHSLEGEWNFVTKAEYFLAMFQGKAKRSR